MTRRSTRRASLFTDLGWSFLIFTGLCLGGAVGLLVLHLGGVR